MMGIKIAGMSRKRAVGSVDEQPPRSNTKETPKLPPMTFSVQPESSIRGTLMKWYDRNSAPTVLRAQTPPNSPHAWCNLTA